MLDKIASPNPGKQHSFSASASVSSAKMYERVENVICERIRDGTLKPGTRLDNIDELAKELDVSSGTVRHSLQNLAARGILVRRPRAGTFVAGSDARRFAPPAKRAETAQSVLLLVPDIRQPEHAHLARAIQDAASARHIDVLIANTDGKVGRFEEAIYRQLNTAGGNGIAMVPPPAGSLPLSLISEIQKNDVSVVTIHRSIPTIGWPTVAGDVFHSVELTTRHLCDIGCKRIAYADHSEPSETMYTKHYAFLRTLMSAQRTPHAELLMHVPPRPANPSSDWAQNERRVIRQWLAEHPNVDGICCINDALAIDVIAQLTELGRRVPADVAVTGIGNFAHFCGLDTSTLTTVDPNFGDVAEQVFDLLRRMREGESMPEDTRVAVKGKLVIGRSTTRPSHTKRGSAR